MFGDFSFTRVFDPLFSIFSSIPHADTRPYLARDSENAAGTLEVQGEIHPIRDDRLCACALQIVQPMLSKRTNGTGKPRLHLHNLLRLLGEVPYP